jgi:mono/diheme cytochrome c family protein
MRIWVVARPVACVWLLAAFVSVPRTSAADAGDPAQYRALFDQYCVSCHNDRLKTAGLSLQSVDLAQPSARADIFEKVIRKVHGGMMPPAGLPRPDKATADGLVTALRTSLDKTAAAHPWPGRPLLQRLNRTEYANAIRDLLALDVDVSTLLPPDNSGYGFDNVTDVLGVSPMLLESYLTAAGKIAVLAIGDPKSPPAGQVFHERQDASQDKHIEGLPLGTIGGQAFKVTLPADGEYVLEPRLFRTNLGTMRGLENFQQLEIAVDGARVHLAHFGGNEEVTNSSANPTRTGDAVDDRLKARVPIKAGPHTITVAFLERSHVQNTWRLQPFQRSSADTIDFGGYPHLDTFTVTGPYNPTGVSQTPSRRRIFVCSPAAPKDEPACAKTILSTLVRRAYRGQNSDADLDRLLEFYQTERTKGGTFDQGISLALRRMLSSPKFTFRVERDPDGPPGLVYKVSDLELASRLSFFLWSSIPDDELLNIAKQGKLRTPAILQQQVRRMMIDPRATDALVNNFVGQWLYLRNLNNQQPNSTVFPDFDDNLRYSFRHESEMLFESIMHEDHSVLDLLTADYTFVDERLARHYGIPNVYGDAFRRVAVTDENRRGILGEGSFLLVTSNADRTSPVKRGKWILENIFGTPPPPPPPNVPPLPERNGAQPTTMRAQMEQHRKNPVCAGCHQMMDPIGLSLENFDAVGAWRVREVGNIQEKGPVIDASGQLLDGTKINGPAELRKAIMRRPEDFVQTFTEKLMTYALGRGVGAQDMPTVRAVVQEAAAKNYSFSSIVLGIVDSTPFQMRMKPLPANDAPPVTVAAR